MIVFDANVLIAYLDDHHVHHRRAEELLAREVDDDFGTTSVTLAEVLVMPAREQRLDDVRAALRDLEVQELSFPTDVATRLAQLRADTSLKMPDCCVLLAAEHAEARIASFDEQLAQAATACHLTTVTS